MIQTDICSFCSSSWGFSNEISAETVYFCRNIKNTKSRKIVKSRSWFLVKTEYSYQNVLTRDLGNVPIFDMWVVQTCIFLRGCKWSELNVQILTTRITSRTRFDDILSTLVWFISSLFLFLQQRTLFSYEFIQIPFYPKINWTQIEGIREQKSPSTPAGTYSNLW